MSESKSKTLGEQHSLWLYRDFLAGDQADAVLESARKVGRVERWGHAANIRIWADGEDVVLVVTGNVIATRAGAAESIRLGRGDAFGKTARGRNLSKTSAGDDLVARRETTLCSIPRQKLRQIWESENAQKSVEAGGWFRKTLVEVPVWPLLGTMPTTRLARILLHLVENYGEVEGDRGRLPITIRPRQLAELAGIDGDRASRIWALFERTGLVEVESASVVLKDLSTLRQYSLG